MLTPSAKDPKREQELERAKEDPKSFGASHEAKVQKAVADKKAASK